MPALFRGQGLQYTLGPGLDRQDAFYRRVRIRAVMDRSLQRGDQVLPGVAPQQRQHPLRLILAVTLCLKQTLQEAATRRSQLREPFLQLRLALP